MIIRLEYEYSNLKLIPCITTNRQSAKIGTHFVIKQSKLGAELFGYKTKKTATDLKNGKSFGTTLLSFVLKELDILQFFIRFKDLGLPR